MVLPCAGSHMGHLAEELDVGESPVPVRHQNRIVAGLAVGETVILLTLSLHPY